MTLLLDDSLIEPLHLSADEMKLNFAVGLYAGRKVSLGKAARIAGMPTPRFQKHVGALQIPLHYAQEDWEQDLKLVREQA
jgi:predicted HTH domain antitoxin